MVSMKKLASRTAYGLVVTGIFSSALLTNDQAAIAATKVHNTVFNVKFGGVSVGNLTFGVSVDGKDYELTGNGRTKGLAEWFASGKADMKSDGILDGDHLIASKHHLTVTENKKKSTLNMSFANGTVQNVSLVPDKRKPKKPKKYVPITPEDLVDVVDPASTLVVPVELAKATDPNAVCGRTYRVYDGDTRYDMKLSYKNNQKVTTKGYDGFAYVCKLQYIPVSGHKRKHKNTKRMAENNNMEIWLAPISAGTQTQSIFTAIRIVVPTWLGTFSAEPEYFGPAKS